MDIVLVYGNGSKQATAFKMGTYQQVNNSFLTDFEMAPERIVYSAGASTGKETTLLYYNNKEK